MTYAKYFNYRGHRYTIIRGGMSRELAEEKLQARRELAPQHIWAIHKTRETSKYFRGADKNVYDLGRR